MRTDSNDRWDGAKLLRPDGTVDREALALFWQRSVDRLRRIVTVRMSRSLQGKLDPDDVLQETFLEAQARLEEYLRKPEVEPMVWLRSLACQKLSQLHRHYVTQKRSLHREVPLRQNGAFSGSSEVLRTHFLGSERSPSSVAKLGELKAIVNDMLQQLEPIDHEIIVLRHFELLTGSEAAQSLGISENTARQRYFRALKRFKGILSALPGGGSSLC